MSDSLLLQSPASPRHLFLLFHGVGASAQDLAPLGLRLAQEFPEAAIVSVGAPDRSEFGGGRQWFSVMGVTEANRLDRVAATLPRFVASVKAWQQELGVAPRDTTLVGFSQGAIMSLAATQLPEPPAGRVASLSGRYPALPTQAPAGVRLHFVHGASDPVIPAAHAQAAAHALREQGAQVTLDVLPGLAHGTSRAAEDLLVARLKKD